MATYCRECGTMLQEDESVCRRCGTPVNMQPTQQEPEQSYQQEPVQNYQQPPVQNYQQLPVQNYQQLPVQNYRQPPVQNYQQLPTLVEYKEEELFRDLDPYYFDEFVKIKESGGQYKGKFNISACVIWGPWLKKHTGSTGYLVLWIISLVCIRWIGPFIYIPMAIYSGIKGTKMYYDTYMQKYSSSSPLPGRTS